MDSSSGIVKACLADKRHSCDAVPADVEPGACTSSVLPVHQASFTGSCIDHICILNTCLVLHRSSVTSQRRPSLTMHAGACDGMLRWFEEYAKRLNEGVYGVSLQPQTQVDLGVPPTLAVDLFPIKPPVCEGILMRDVAVCSRPSGR